MPGLASFELASALKTLVSDPWVGAGLYAALRAELSNLRTALQALVFRTDQLERRIEEAEQSGFDLVLDEPSEAARETEARSGVTRSLSHNSCN